jgi:hypothetical protein
MKNWPIFLGLFALFLLGGVYWWSTKKDIGPNLYPETKGPQEEALSQPETIKHPVTLQPEEEQQSAALLAADQTLPELKASDEAMEHILSQLFSDQKLDRFFILEHFIERAVVMVDNLPKKELPRSHRPIRPIQGNFLAKGDRENLSIDPANYERYVPLVKAILKLDTDVVVAVYKRLYPLFQQAYERIGYPDAYFNDRLIEVIDHLLETPIMEAPISLKQPKALYLFAEPEMEALSAGRKILIRIGPQNALMLKEILQEYRRKLTSVPR